MSSATAQVLMAARKRIATLGWCQHSYHLDDGSVCSSGAIHTVAGRLGNTFADKDRALLVLAEAAGAHANPHLPEQAVVHWNDAPGRTKEEVLAAFDRAIAKAEGRDPAEEEKVGIGEFVVYRNEMSVEHLAIVLAVHPPRRENPYGTRPGLNLVFIDAMNAANPQPRGENAEPKIVCSVVHKDVTPCHGNYWREATSRDMDRRYGCIGAPAVYFPEGHPFGADGWNALVKDNHQRYTGTVRPSPYADLLVIAGPADAYGAGRRVHHNIRMGGEMANGERWWAWPCREESER